MNRPLPLLLILLCLGACRDEPAGPAWLHDLAVHIEAQPVTDPPSRIVAFRYRDQQVYYRPPYCCDVQGVLYTGTGDVICHPDGGFSGRGDGRCADFFAARSDCVLVWSDPRAKPDPSGDCAPVSARPNPLQ